RGAKGFYFLCTAPDEAANANRSELDVVTRRSARTKKIYLASPWRSCLIIHPILPNPGGISRCNCDAELILAAQAVCETGNGSSASRTLYGPVQRLFSGETPFCEAVQPSLDHSITVRCFFNDTS